MNDKRKGSKIIAKVASVVTVVIAVLITVVIRDVMAYRKSEMVSATRSWLNVNRKALELYRNDHGRYPTETEGLHALQDSIGSITNDAWKTPFRYRMAEGRPQIESAGPDKKFNTADDIQEIAPNKGMNGTR